MMPNPVRLIVTINGRTYTGVVNVAQEVPDFDGEILAANGWVVLPPSSAEADPLALLKTLNLADLLSTTTARSNLGLGTAATAAASSFATSTQGNTADAALAKASNLSDLGNAGNARTNLGLGTAATHNASEFATVSLTVNSQAGNYTTNLGDTANFILHPTADANNRTYIIAANANVAVPIGQALTFVNEINTVTVDIDSDELILAGAGSNGPRTLAASGIAVALKKSATSWIISGTGLA
jgi:hypothetical protein